VYPARLLLNLRGIPPEGGVRQPQPAQKVQVRRPADSGSDPGYRDQLDKELVYQFNNGHHGKIAKRSIETPQICTRV
jgi:hypothetical protein